MAYHNDYSYQPYRPPPPGPPAPQNPYVSRLDPGRPAKFDAYFDPTLQRPQRPPHPKLDTAYHGPAAMDRPVPPAPLSPYHDSPTSLPRRPLPADAAYYEANRPGSTSPFYGTSERDDDNDYYDPYNPRKPKPRQYSDEIPLRENPGKFGQESKPTSPDRSTGPTPDGTSPDRQPDDRQRKGREPEEKKFFSWNTPWVVYGFTLIQLVVFIAELVRNSVLTSSPIEIHPQINPMLGPSFAVLINMGARYVPCMKNVTGIPVDTAWPCPNTTTLDPNDPSNQCNIAELCGFTDFGANPNQWFRFITPIFLHAGLVHIGFNLLLQLTLGREIERIIGPIRFVVVYMSSGIFGFVLGGNFAASGIASMGASGALFGIIAINLLDLLYTWNDRVSPKKELAFILLDIVVSFALGLLPGLDNFSHIGGFLMGLVLGICILHSPNLLRKEKVITAAEPLSEQPKKPVRSGRAKRVSYKSFAKDPAGFFKGRKALWWVWWLVRAGAFLGVLIAFIVLLNNFYMYHDTCSWCKYLSCINVNNWCDMGNLTAQLVQHNSSQGTSPAGSSGGTNARLLARSIDMVGGAMVGKRDLGMVDLSGFF